MYAGTEFGIYYSLDDGENWRGLQLNLPIVPVTDLALKDQDLIAATQGRGFWILDDLSVLHQTTPGTAKKVAHLYAPRPGYRLTADKGLNRFAWDLRYPGMHRFENLIMWADMKEGPRAVPGEYRARLSVDGNVQEVRFEIRPDPRTTSTSEDYAAQFSFVMGSRDLLSRTHVEIRKIRQLQTVLESLQVRFAKAGEGDADVTELLAEITALLQTVTPIEEALYQTSNESRQDPLNYPIRLNNKLTSLMRTAAVGDARPTAAAEVVRDELSMAIESELEQLDAVWNENLPALNGRIQSMGIDLITVSYE